MSKQGSLGTALTSSPCDAKVSFSRTPRDTAREVSSITDLVWYIVGVMRRRGGAAVE